MPGTGLSLKTVFKGLFTFTGQLENGDTAEKRRMSALFLVEISGGLWLNEIINLISWI
jgi:hypothetical protein